MNSKKYLGLTAFILIGIAGLSMWQWRTTAQTDSKAVRLSLRTDRAEYALGEIVALNFEISNQTDAPVELVVPDVRAGTLKVFVSSDGATFREYIGPRWGTLNVRRQMKSIESGGHLEIRSTMLYNKTFASDHLTEHYAEQIRKDNLGTDFAIISPGRYWLKAAYSDGRTKLESEPVVIDVNVPSGMDALVWERIKANKAYAYFLQTGDLKFIPGSTEEQEFVASLRRLAEEFPGTKFAVKVEQGLTKRNAMLDELQR